MGDRLENVILLAGFGILTYWGYFWLVLQKFVAHLKMEYDRRSRLFENQVRFTSNVDKI